ncbi:MAG: hypothetical protein ACYDER_11890 [Ktedonobacteraceae bacterium]
MELSEYNGWENKFTWLVHLHLSNEQAVMQEVTALVASTSRNRAAGRLLKTWVKASLFNWLSAFSLRDSHIDATMRLLVWDMVGTAMAYTDWDALVVLFTGRVKKSNNLFTMTLFQFILSDEQLLAFIWEMMGAFSNTYECADTMKGWFREQVDALFHGPDMRPQPEMAALVDALLETTYRVIVWQHVARAFRPEY